MKKIALLLIVTLAFSILTGCNADKGAEGTDADTTYFTSAEETQSGVTDTSAPIREPTEESVWLLPDGAGVYRVKEGGTYRYGLVGSSGARLTEFVYDSMTAVSKTLVAAVRDGKTEFLTSAGKSTGGAFAGYTALDNGTFIIYEGEKANLCLSTGKRVFSEPVYSVTRVTEDGRLFMTVKEKGGGVTLCDENGNICSTEFSHLKICGGRLLIDKTDGGETKYGVIAYSGEGFRTVYALSAETISRVYCGFDFEGSADYRSASAYLVKEGGMWALVNDDGNAKTGFVYTDMYSDENGAIIGVRGGNAYYLDFDGVESSRVEPYATGVTLLSGKLTVAKCGAFAGAYYGAFDKAGKLVIPCRYTRFYEAGENRVFAINSGSNGTTGGSLTDGSVVLYDSEGNILLDGAVYVDTENIPTDSSRFIVYKMSGNDAVAFLSDADGKVCSAYYEKLSYAAADKYTVTDKGETFTINANGEKVG